ncbi:DUF4184 family protein [Yinghuangia soli]|uniref:DUF4184 family protein n=1 Tax=Yinghuangia soli TaxID=2908204 RepID=A0AA41Q855_9ACTN|nr:DUF4184 family protein [Yinghuangia soli]MCF2533373.1 DUF4184 family protein [Yinghuangia soli]
MPLTLSHIAAVLPMQSGTRTGLDGRRGPLVASAMAFATMAPDAIFFFPLEWLPFDMSRTGTHSVVPGVLASGVVVTAACVAVWHLLLLRPLLALLPDAVRDRVADPLLPRLPGRIRAARREGRPWAGEVLGTAGWFVVSAWIGGLTHVFWDAWGHYNDPGVADVAPWLRDEGLFGRPWFVLVQHTGTAVGLIGLAWWGMRQYRRLPILPPVPGTHLAVPWRIAVVGLLALAGLVGAVDETRPYAGGSFEEIGYYFATGFGRALGFALLAYGASRMLYSSIAARSRAT